MSSICTLPNQKVIRPLFYFFTGCAAMYAAPAEPTDANKSREVVDTELVLPTAENVIKLMAQFYLNSFVNAKEDQKAKQQLADEEIIQNKRKLYDIEKPILSEKARASILLSEVFGPRNSAQKDFFNEIASYTVDMRVKAWNTMNILEGSINSPDKTLVNACLPPGAQQIRAVSMGLFLVTPIADIGELRKRQERTAVFVNNPSLRKKFEKQFERIDKLEPSFLTLYDKSQDPMFSPPYQKGLQASFSHKQGKFISPWLIEFNKRWKLELSNLLLTCFFFAPLYPVVAMLICFLTKDNAKDAEVESFVACINPLTYFSMFYKTPIATLYTMFVNKSELDMKGILAGASVIGHAFSLIVWGIAALPKIKEMLAQYKTYNTYISERLADARELLLAAKEISEAVSSDPALESLYGDKLKHTRQLLAQQHTNPSYNRLAKLLLENDFGKWNLFFNSIGTLMTTMTLLGDNIHMFDEVIFELGSISVFLSFARLVLNPAGNKNTYTFGRYYTEEEKSAPYLDFKNSWSISLEPNRAVANDLHVDGKLYNTAAIMGPNGCGKSVIFIRNTFENVLLMQTGGIVAGEGGLTPFWAIFTFKEPKDDPSVQKSLFTRELDSVNLHADIIAKHRKLGKNTVTFYDEYFNSTNLSESIALQTVMIEDVMNNFPKNISIISTHNSYVNRVILNSKKGAMFHVRILRHKDGSYTPLYKVGRGITREKVGIDLFEKVTGNKQLADKARKIRDQLEAAHAA